MRLDAAGGRRGCRQECAVISVIVSVNMICAGVARGDEPQEDF